jgi:hypothetical protein
MTAIGNTMKITSLLSTIAAAAAFGSAAYAADIVTTGDLNTVNQWYGRAGGLSGSDRVGQLHVGQNKVGVTFDQEVAARTHMSTESRSGQLGVTWDRDVAARTNMQREDTKTSNTANVPGPTHN